jgi:hypothetical protein
MSKFEGSFVSSGNVEMGGSGTSAGQEGLMKNLSESEFAKLEESGCNQLVSYLKGLTSEQRYKINYPLNLVIRDIRILAFISKEREEEAMGVLVRLDALKNSTGSDARALAEELDTLSDV